MNLRFLFVVVLLAIFLAPSACFCQISSEKKMIESIKREKNETKKYLLQLSLGELYKIKNIYRADSMKQVLLYRSRGLGDSIRYSALMFNAEINEIQGNQEEYFKDVLALEPFLGKLNNFE
ncbi:MAG: hypothetical protein RJA13_1759, partial [Bacteroidota bacterium]